MTSIPKILILPILGAIVSLTACIADKDMSSEPSNGSTALASSLSGEDTDINGIRDDVDSFIDEKFVNEDQLQAARRLARVLQQTILIDKSQAHSVQEVSVEIMKAMSCVFYSFPASKDRPIGAAVASEVVEQLEARTANTRERLRAYLEFSDAMSGTVSSLPNDSACSL